jgi:hypothetical protein
MDNRYDYTDQFDGPPPATAGQCFWLCALILSFCYELPLAQVTSFDRLNPRLFDLTFLLGVFTILPNLRGPVTPSRVYRLWSLIILTFTICALAWIAFLPLEEVGYSMFFLFRYFQGFVVVYIVARLSLTEQQKRKVHYMVVAGGIVVALYAIPEYLRGGGGRMLIAAEGKEVVMEKGTLLSCLGPTYFHVAMFSTLASVMTLSLASTANSAFGKFFCLFLAAFVSWPAFFSGARAGIIACVLAWTALFLMARASFKMLAIGFVGLALFLAVLVAPRVLSFDYLSEKSAAFRRLTTAEEKGSGGSIKSRISLDFYDISYYRWQGWRIPFIGAGFYIAPHTYPSGERVWRIGYGVHNIYLFALEQGGIAAFVLFIAFLWRCHKELTYVRKWAYCQPDYSFALGMVAFFYAMIVVGFPGQVFWQGFGTENFNTYLLVLLVIATRFSLASYGQDAAEPYGYPGYDQGPEYHSAETAQLRGDVG